MPLGTDRPVAPLAARLIYFSRVPDTKLRAASSMRLLMVHIILLRRVRYRILLPYTCYVIGTDGTLSLNGGDHLHRNYPAIFKALLSQSSRCKNSRGSEPNEGNKDVTKGRVIDYTKEVGNSSRELKYAGKEHGSISYNAWTTNDLPVALHKSYAF
jgi:hypothetical protein